MGGMAIGKPSVVEDSIAPLMDPAALGGIAVTTAAGDGVIADDVLELDSAV